MWNPLRSEALKILDGVMRRKYKKFADQVESFIVRYVRRRFLGERLAIDILERALVLFEFPQSFGMLT